MRITVSRQPGTNPAPAIVEPLLRGIPALTARGQAELNERGFSRRIVSLEVPAEPPLILPGTLIEVAATPFEPAWRGKVVAVSGKAAAGAMPVQNLAVERLA
jgi:hypothetical protein